MAGEPRYAVPKIEDVRRTLIASLQIPGAKAYPAGKEGEKPSIPVEYKLGAIISDEGNAGLKGIVDTMLNDEAVVDRLKSVYSRGQAVPRLRKVMIEGPVRQDDPFATFPRFEEKDGVLTLPFSLEHPGWDLAQSMVTALRQPARNVVQELNPLGTELVGRGLLRNEDVRRAEEVGSWRKFKPDGYSGGRSATLSIPEFDFQGTCYDTLKLKGVVRSKVLQPGGKMHAMSIGSGKGRQFTAEVEIQPSGEIRPVEYLNPEGGLTHKKAVQENEGFMAFHRKGRAGELVIGQAKYLNADFSGEPTGYALTVMPKGSVEAGTELMRAIKEEYDRDKKNEMDCPMARTRINSILVRTGMAIRGAHDDDLFHGYPSYSNIINVGGDYKFKDFHQSRDVSGATKKQKLAYRLHDIAANIRHTAIHILDEAKNSQGYAELPEFLKKIGISPTTYLLRGYFHDRQGDPRIAGITQADVEMTYRFCITPSGTRPSLNLMSMLVETAGLTPRLQYPGPANMLTMEALKGDSKVTIPECIGLLRGRNGEMRRLSEKGYLELILAEDDGGGRVATDGLTKCVMLYFPKGTDKAGLGIWLDRSLQSL